MDANCLRVRRALTTEPESLDAESASHLAQCAGCTDFARRSRHFEHTLRAAVAVAPPPGLAQRILARQQVVVARSRRAPRLALAAGVLLAVGIGAGVWLDRVIPRTAPPAMASAFGTELLAHVTAEGYATRPQTVRSTAHVRLVLERVGAILKRPLDNVTFVNLCPFDDDVAAHLVVRTDRGPVSVLLAPGARVHGTMHLHTDAGEGLLIERDGGAMGLVGPDRATLEREAERIGGAIAWGARSA